MYREDIQDIKGQKREMAGMIVREFVRIYVQMRWFFPSLKEERESLLQLVKQYLAADRNETELLNLLNDYYGSWEDHEAVDELLEELDESFIHFYEHCEKTFEDYDSVLLEYGDFLGRMRYRMACLMHLKQEPSSAQVRYRLKHRAITFPIVDDDYKEKMKVMIPQLPKPVEEEF